MPCGAGEETLGPPTPIEEYSPLLNTQAGLPALPDDSFAVLFGTAGEQVTTSEETITAAGDAIQEFLQFTAENEMDWDAAVASFADAEATKQSLPLTEAVEGSEPDHSVAAADTIPDHESAVETLLRVVEEA
ncbi:uncharacterized protein LTR77_005258 [Saxophila tyrrhenica]|uniref:Uncharacterized protein n=1 Tax=Saxophila tyrrhenica TaxID=1690608 RepID=A0AAV9PC88_9PEZI|nr:hypothetical protein LTR77_005258 [Saxophila tyrrhenica]